MSPFRSGELRVVSLNYNEQFTKIHIFLASETAVIIRNVVRNQRRGCCYVGPVRLGYEFEISNQ